MQQMLLVVFFILYVLFVPIPSHIKNAYFNSYSRRKAVNVLNGGKASGIVEFIRKSILYASLQL